MPLGQSGPPGWCEAFRGNPNFNSQGAEAPPLLREKRTRIKNRVHTWPDTAWRCRRPLTRSPSTVSYESPGDTIVGPYDFASAKSCLANAHLDATVYASALQPHGQAGFEHFIGWVKSRLIAGDVVSIGILDRFGSDAQYDHEVTVVKVGTNHALDDARYYADDVLYWEDHGAYGVLLDAKPGASDLDPASPAVPPGAADNATCAPFLFGYQVSLLANTRDQANRDTSLAYSIVLPGAPGGETQDGGDGYASAVRVSSRNFGFAASGLHDPTGVTRLVSVAIVASSTGGKANPRDPVCGYAYESPYIGTSPTGSGCSNAQPQAMSITLQATVHGLTPGVAYVLYEFQLPGVSGTGAAAALPVPTSAFNRNAGRASHATPFNATASTYVHQVTRLSSQVVVFRCVAASAP